MFASKFGMDCATSSASIVPLRRSGPCPDARPTGPFASGTHERQGDRGPARPPQLGSARQPEARGRRLGLGVATFRPVRAVSAAEKLATIVDSIELCTACHAEGRRFEPARRPQMRVQGLVHPWRREAFRRSIQWIGRNCARLQPIVATVSQHPGRKRCELAGGNLKQKARSQWLPARTLIARSSAAISRRRSIACAV
jgi:hypothetical protein